MEYITIFEISRYDFMCLPVLLYAFAAFGTFVEVVKKREMKIILKILVLIALIVGGSIIIRGNLTPSGAVRNDYYTQRMSVEITEGTICNLEKAGACTYGYFDLNGKSYTYERIYKAEEDFFGDRYQAIREDGQRLRITYVSLSEFERGPTILKVEMAKEDVPPEKLDKLMKKYENDKHSE